MELTSVGGKAKPSFRGYASSQDMGSDSIMEEDEKLELQWAAIERLPTFEWLKSSLFHVNHDNEGSHEKDVEGKRVTDVIKLGALERHLFIEKLIKHIENDNLQLLQKLTDTIDSYV